MGIKIFKIVVIIKNQVFIRMKRMARVFKGAYFLNIMNNKTIIWNILIVKVSKFNKTKCLRKKKKIISKTI